MTYESLTPERGVDGAIRRAIDYLRSGRGQEGAESSSKEASTKYDICGQVSAEGLEKLVMALQAIGASDDLDLKRRPHDPYDTHSTRLNGWTDLRPWE
ncbi:hypothetical protein ACFPK1_12545 [Actinomycetospora rhizophila]|uniref:Uncharacterized protein n=1 Tax=Actinomycetospora rhizophila TaxID=1416876 RepID=A0ABV9ZG02_9PSEU